MLLNDSSLLFFSFFSSSSFFSLVFFLSKKNMPNFLVDRSHTTPPLSVTLKKELSAGCFLLFSFFFPNLVLLLLPFHFYNHFPFCIRQNIKRVLSELFFLSLYNRKSCFWSVIDTMKSKNLFTTFHRVPSSFFFVHTALISLTFIDYSFGLFFSLLSLLSVSIFCLYFFA